MKIKAALGPSTELSGGVRTGCISPRCLVLRIGGLFACEFWCAFPRSLTLGHLGDKISEREKGGDEVKVNCWEVEG